MRWSPRRPSAVRERAASRGLHRPKEWGRGRRDAGRARRWLRGIQEENSRHRKQAHRINDELNVSDWVRRKVDVVWFALVYWDEREEWQTAQVGEMGRRPEVGSRCSLTLRALLARGWRACLGCGLGEDALLDPLGCHLNGIAMEEGGKGRCVGGVCVWVDGLDEEDVKKGKGEGRESKP